VHAIESSANAAGHVDADADFDWVWMLMLMLMPMLLLRWTQTLASQRHVCTLHSVVQRLPQLNVTIHQNFLNGGDGA
jgi:uncharacterized protein VirK/YbjX